MRVCLLILQVYGFVLSCILYRDGNTAIAAMETMNAILLSSSPLFSQWLVSPLPDTNMATQFWLEHAQGTRGEGGGREEGGGEEGEEGEQREGGEEGEERGEEQSDGGKVGEGAEEEKREIFLKEGHFIAEASSLGEVTFFCYCNVVFYS